MHIVITYPYALGIGGGSALDCLECARHLRRAGAEVTVLSVSTTTMSRFPRPRPTREQMGYPEEAMLNEAGVNVVRVEPNRLHFLLDGLPVRSALRDMLQKQTIDAVVGWFNEAAFLPAFLRAHSIRFGMIAAASYARHVVRKSDSEEARRNVWASGVARIKDGVRPLWLHRPLRKADVVFARSGFTAGEIVDLLGVDEERVVISYCGIDPLFFDIVRTQPDTISNLIFVGSLDREKGLQDALEALQRVSAMGYEDWTLRVAGKGNASSFDSQIDSLGLGNHIQFLGYLDRDALKRELGLAHLAIIPSHGESFGLAVAEAQVAGLPVVAYRVGAVPELIEHGVTGWLVPLRRPDRLAQAVVQAIESPRLTYEAGQAGRKRMRNRFSWTRTAEQMLHELRSETEPESSARVVAS